MYRVFKVEIGSEGFDEQIGSKEKYWIEHPDLGKCLFKYSRPDTGEHWAEKVACVIARELFLPHAQYELARYGQRWGILSPSFTPEGYALVHANELLAALFPDYDPGAKGRRNKHYTVKSASELLNRIDVPYPHLVDPPSLVTSADWFTGYLLLDALIGNTDRHAENWGALRSNIWSPALLLAPTFDHASSLGRELRQGRLGVDSVQAYAQRARSALFATPEGRKALSPFEAFSHFAAARPLAGRYWRERLRDISEPEFNRYIDWLPPDSCSQPSRDFAKAILQHNRTRLLQ